MIIINDNCNYACSVRLTHAVVSSVDLHVLRWADAGVVSNGVVTLTWTTDARPLTLIHIYTHNINSHFFSLSNCCSWSGLTRVYVRCWVCLHWMRQSECFKCICPVVGSSASSVYLLSVLLIIMGSACSWLDLVRETERVCERGSMTDLHRSWCLHWVQNLLDIHSGNCQTCWCSFLPDTDQAAPDTRWYLTHRHNGQHTALENMCVCVCVCSIYPLVSLWSDWVGILLLRDTEPCTQLREKQ